jgi:hypothetical protein
MVPTLCARTTGATAGDGDGVGVGVAVGDGDGDVAAGPPVCPPHAAKSSAEQATTVAIRNKRTRAITADRYTV